MTDRNKIYCFESPGWPIDLEKIYSYYIEWDKIIVSCLQEARYRDENKKNYRIKNWKIDMNQLVMDYDWRISEETFEDSVRRYKNLCSPHILDNMKITVFVMSKYLNKQELNKCIDKKIEDLRKWREELNELSIKLWLLHNDINGDNMKKSKEKWNYKEYMEWVENIEKKYWCSRAEMLFWYNKTLNILKYIQNHWGWRIEYGA